VSPQSGKPQARSQVRAERQDTMFKNDAVRAFEKEVAREVAATVERVARNYQLPGEVLMIGLGGSESSDEKLAAIRDILNADQEQE
jgi:Holliday junction resolvase RusA-like endonuclease